MTVAEIVGETTITGKGQVSLPARGLRALDWKKGDHLLVETLGRDFILLVRRPASWTETFAGRLSAVYGDHDDVVRLVREERAGWSAE